MGKDDSLERDLRRKEFLSRFSDCKANIKIERRKKASDKAEMNLQKVFLLYIPTSSIFLRLSTPWHFSLAFPFVPHDTMKIALFSLLLHFVGRGWSDRVEIAIFLILSLVGRLKIPFASTHLIANSNLILN